MSLTKTWKTTERPEGPRGHKKNGTFRDISLVGVNPEDIDDIDAACMERGILRSEYVLELLSSWKGDAEFNRIFDGTKYADKFWPEIDKRRTPLLGWEDDTHRPLRRLNYWRNAPRHRQPTAHDWGEEAYGRGFVILMKQGIKPGEPDIRALDMSGRREVGTFRDLTLVGVASNEIERIDAVCRRRGILRSDYIVDMLSTIGYGGDEFNTVFGGTQYVDAFWPDIDRSEAERLGWQEVHKIARQRVLEWRDSSGELEATISKVGNHLSDDGPPSEPD